MEELPSLQLTEEALFASGQCGDVDWPDRMMVPDDGQDVDIFTLVEALDLDEGMDLDEGTTLPDCAPTQHTQQAPPIATQRKNDHTQRIERTRARNRQAQARYRQKAKV